MGVVPRPQPVVEHHPGAAERLGECPALAGSGSRRYCTGVAYRPACLVYATRWDIRTGRHCVVALHAHLVFVTKYRHPVFTDLHLDRMEEIMRAVCEDFELRTGRVQRREQHVHLLVNFPPNRRPVPSWSTASRASLPGGCARSFPTWPGTTGGPGRCGRARTSPGSVGGAPSNVMRAHIEQQRRPHDAIHSGLKAGTLSRKPGSVPADKRAPRSRRSHGWTVQAGVAGLAVMGGTFARDTARRGFPVAIYDRTRADPRALESTGWRATVSRR